MCLQTLHAAWNHSLDGTTCTRAPNSATTCRIKCSIKSFAVFIARRPPQSTLFIASRQGLEPATLWQGQARAAGCGVAPEQAVGRPHRAMDDSPSPETQRSSPSPDAKISKSPAASRKLEVGGHSGDPQTDLDDPSLANADIECVKNKASERVNTLINDLETGSFGASKVRACRPCPLLSPSPSLLPPAFFQSTQSRSGVTVPRVTV